MIRLITIGSVFILAMLVFDHPSAIAQIFEARIQVFAPNVDSTFELSELSAIEFTLQPDSNLAVYLAGGMIDRINMRDIDSLVFSPDTAHTTLRFLFANGSDSTYSVAAVDSIVIPPIAVSGLVSPAKSADGFVACYPNPSTGAMSIILQLPKPDRVKLALYDEAGKLVRDFGEMFYTSGTQTIAWDGFDARGEELPVGAYLLRVQCSQETTALKLALFH